MNTATITKVTPKIGDILYSSWGYDQTNIDFYKVVKVSEFSVWIQETGKEIVEVTGWAHEKVMPTGSTTYQTRNWDKEKDEWDNVNPFITKTYPISRHKIKHFDWKDEESYYVTLNSFSHASLWDGKPKDASHTH